jgi:hypothetical protein
LIDWCTQLIQGLKEEMAVSTRGDKSICLPVARYQQIIADNQGFRAYILVVWANHPETLPKRAGERFLFSRLGLFCQATTADASHQAQREWRSLPITS